MSDVSIIPNFLGTEAANRLLEFAIDNADLFDVTRVGQIDGGNIDERIRRSFRLKEMGEFAPLIESAVNEALPRVVLELGIRPFDVGFCETELIAHGDRGFYQRHIDTVTGTSRSLFGDRVVSFVYYVHCRPKCFSGGNLRIYPMPTSTFAAMPLDIAPEHDTLVAFSSWLPHEVMPVTCPTASFEHSRFSVNCWVYQQSEPVAMQAG